MISITATKRSKADKLDQLRINGMVPAVVYGANTEVTSLAIESRILVKAWKEAGESTPVALSYDSEKKNVLFQDVQFHPVKGHIMHVDFLAVDMNKPVEVAIQLEFVGVAPAEKNNLGTLVKVLHEVEVEALPKDLPHTLEVDISTLVDLDTQITVADIKLPAGVTMITDGEEVVALVAAQKEESEESAPLDLSAIEVEKKGKKEEAESND
ncbi:MAG: 50S ribosomal protein L25 [bacterium]